MARIPGVGLPVWAELTARGYRGASVCGSEFTRSWIVAWGADKGVSNVIGTFRSQNNESVVVGLS